MKTRLHAAARPVNIALILIWATALFFWIRIWRLGVYQGDDMMFMSRSRLPGGAVTLKSFWEGLLWDINERNGRTSDAFVQLSLGFGLTSGNWVVLAIYCWLFTLLVWWFVKTAVGARRIGAVLNVVLAVVAALLPMAMGAWEKGLLGPTIFFPASTVNTFLGLIVLLLGLSPWIQQLRTGHVPSWMLWVSIPVMIFVDYFHEAAALAVAGACFGIVLLWRRVKMPKLLLLAVALAFIFSLVRFGNSGLWKRVRMVKKDDNAPEAFYTALSHLPRVHVVIFSVLTVLLVLAAIVAMIRSRSKAHRIALAASSVVLIGSGLAWRSAGPKAVSANYAATRKWDVYPEHGTLPVVLFVIFALAMVAVAFLIGVRTAPAVEPTEKAASEGERSGGSHRADLTPGVRPRSISAWSLPLILISSAFGALVIPVAVGYIDGRAPYYAIALFTIAALLLAVTIVSETRRTMKLAPAALVAGLLLIVVPVQGLQQWNVAFAEMKKNHAVWQQVMAQMDLVHQGRTKAIFVTRRMPSPDYAINWPKGGQLPPHYSTVLDIPKDVKIVRERDEELWPNLKKKKQAQTSTPAPSKAPTQKPSATPTK